MNSIRSEIGLCVRTLFFKEWGRVPVYGPSDSLRRARIRSQSWWELRLSQLIEDPTEISLEFGMEQVIDYPPRDLEFENFLTDFYKTMGDI